MTQGKPQTMWPLCDIQQEVRRLFHELVHQSWGGKEGSDSRLEGIKAYQIALMADKQQGSSRDGRQSDPVHLVVSRPWTADDDTLV